MARIFTTGWETGDIDEVESTNEISGLSATNSIVNSSPLPRYGGNYCLRTLVTADSSGYAWRRIILSAINFHIYSRIGVYFHSVVGGTAECAFMAMTDSLGTVQHCLTWSQSDHLLRLRWGGTPSGALLATSTMAFAEDQWHPIQMDTWMGVRTTVRVGYSDVILFSGDNTITGQNDLRYIGLGLSGTGLQAGAYVAFDDFAISNNGYPGDGRVVLLVPVGPGTFTTLSRGGVDTGANWSQVNELPPSMAQYVQETAYNRTDLYQMSNLPADASWILVVEAIILARQTDVSGGNVYAIPTIRSSGTNSSGSGPYLPLTAGLKYYVSRFELDPATANAWTPSAVNAVEAGVAVQ